LAAAALAVAGWAVLRPRQDTVPALPVARFESPFREGQAPLGRWIAPTPDGSGVVYLGPGRETGVAQLWIRRWRDIDATRIPDTESARNPAVSPDGSHVAYVTGNPGPLRVTPLGGGQSRTIVDRGYGPIAWSDDGWIYFRSPANVLARVRSTGGTAEALTELASGEALHWLPHPLPGGRQVLLTVAGSPNGDDATIAVLDIETRQWRPITAGNTPWYVASGHLLFGTERGTLMAAAFDPERAELTGDPAVLVEGLGFDQDYLHMAYGVSADGSLVYWVDGARPEYQFVWVSGAGDVTPISEGERFSLSSVGNLGWRLSPDGRRIAFRRTVDDNDDIWIKELPDGPRSRFTSGEEVDAVPTWTPDGRSIVWRKGNVGQGQAWSQPVDGSRPPQLVFDEFNVAKAVWSPDGEWLVIRKAGVVGDERARDILALRPGIDSAAIPLVAHPDFWEQAPAVSRDGRWLAYSSNETGRHEIFVRPFPDVDGGKWQVSTGGGVVPVWAHSGRELFFADPSTREIRAAPFTPGVPAFQAGPVRTVFEMPPDIHFAPSGNMDFYDVAPGDDRFLMAREVGTGGGRPGLILVQNFLEELARLAPR
jgi:serine/threonine-protein kinase